MLAAKLRAVVALGIGNVFQVALYRGALRARLHPVQKLSAVIGDGASFGPAGRPPVPVEPPSEWQDDAHLFGALRIGLDTSPPDWMVNPINGKRAQRPADPWWSIPDFSAEIGDIKGIWELSRMDWAVAMAQRARNGDASELDRLNLWLRDWCDSNPPFLGPNWKCGQEAGIRLLHLATAALLLGQESRSCAALLDLVRAHLRRIAPTMNYAAAQDNNHATSEAAALFVGGSWLEMNGDGQGKAWSDRGRSQLEKRVTRLVAKDGSFSQYSVNYHRLMLDTLSIAEAWRRRLELSPFSDLFYERARAAWRWLAAMTDSETGDAPNIGANDGARLLQLTSAPYRDFRPSVQLAAALFDNVRVYPQKAIGEVLEWFEIEPARMEAERASRLFDDGGYALLVHDDSFAVMRYPRFRFRPGQADSLHVDLWIKGRNHLRDGGSYSYNDGKQWLDYFSGIGSHNAVQFDDDEPMRRLGRFLFADWLGTRRRSEVRVERGVVSFDAEVTDRCGRAHHRRLSLGAGRMTVEDEVSGFAEKAVLRWRLFPSDWRVEGTMVTDGNHCLEIESTRPLARLELTTGFESRHYLELGEIPVLEAEIRQPALLKSLYRWTP